MTLTTTQKKAVTAERSTCVTAGAGTGKTFLLSRKYQYLLECGAKDHIGPENILALTFTEKAAAEMRERIEEDIRKRAVSEEDPRMKEFWTGILDGFFRCNISTFHGFCSSLLREFAFEAGVDPGFSILEGLDKTDLEEGIIEDFLDKPGELYDDVVYLYQTCALSLPDLVKKILPRYSQIKPWFEKLEADPEGTMKQWEEIVQKENLRLRDAFIADEDNLQTITLIKELAPEYPTVSCLSTLSDAWDALSHAPENTLRQATEHLHSIKMDFGDAKSQIPEKMSKNLKRSTENLQDAFVVVPMEWELELFIRLGRVMEAISEKIGQEKDRRGTLDFDDLIRKASILVGNPAVLSILRKRYWFVLVDEVQDNDPALTKIVTKITGDPGENSGLFIVGDPKQSIYRFRGADVEALHDLEKQFPQDPIQLDISFRTVPEIISLVNHVFKNVFDGEKRYDVSYSDICTSRTGDTGTTTLCLCETGKQKADQAHLSEAKQLASLIADHVKDQSLPVYDHGVIRPAGYGDIAILIKNRTHLPALEHALLSEGIPYEIYKSQRFYQKQEVLDMYNLLEAITCPDVDTSLYAALRSPYFGISDAELCRVRTGKYSFISDLKRWTETNPDSPAGRAYSQLVRWKELAGHEPLTRFIRSVIKESGILSVYSALPGGPGMSANLEKLLSLAREAMNRRADTPELFAALLKTSIDSKVDENEQETNTTDRLKIMTIHASKGLEYPVVALCFAGSSNKPQTEKVYLDEDLGVGLSVFDPNIGSDRELLIKSVLKERVKLENKAERKRLLYVALTRARDHLIISGGVKNGEPEKSSLLSLFYEGLKGFDEKTNRLSRVEGREVTTTPETKQYPVIPDDWEDTEFRPVSGSSGNNVLDVTAAAGYGKVTAQQKAAMVRGKAIHEVFEGVPVSVAAKRYGLSPETQMQFAGWYSAFLESEIMTDVAADVCEQPISYLVGSVRVNGVIDRLIEYQDGSRMVIDYKTGSPSAAELDLYEEQLAVYFLWVIKQFGTEPGVCLYFPEQGKVMPFTMDEERAKLLLKKKIGETIQDSL